MAGGLPVSIKHVEISKANSNMILVVSLAAALSVFSLVTAKALFSQASYQSKVIGERNKAINTLKENIKAKDSLVADYKVFAGGDPNIIGGSATGSGENDGDNARIVLDSLPSKYDYPALATSIQGILQRGGVGSGSFTGTDMEVTNDSTSQNALPATPVEMVFSTSYSGNYATVQKMIGDFERSIRPFVAQKMTIGGKENDLQVNISYSTYYQPSKTLNISSKVVK